MNRDQITAWAREAEFPAANYPALVSDGDWEALERFADLVAAAERQRLHDKFMEIHKSQQHSNNYWHFAARKIKEQE